MKKFYRFLVIFIWIIILILLVGCDTTKGDSYVFTPMEEMKVHAEENGYLDFVNHLEDNVTETERAKILEILDGRYLIRKMQVLNYGSISAAKHYCYINGRYTIPYSVHQFVVWSENILVDPNNENANFNRHYIVEDESKDAYIMICEENSEYRVIHITSEPADVPDEDFSHDGFEVLLKALNNRKNILLCVLAETHEITDDELKQLYENESNFSKLREYVQALPQDEYKDIIEMFESGIVDDGVESIALRDGVYIANSTLKVMWKDNIDIFQSEDETICTIIDINSPAYILEAIDGVYRLMVFNVSNS